MLNVFLQQTFGISREMGCMEEVIRIRKELESLIENPEEISDFYFKDPGAGFDVMQILQQLISRYV